MITLAYTLGYNKSLSLWDNLTLMKNYIGNKEGMVALFDCYSTVMATHLRIGV